MLCCHITLGTRGRPAFRGGASVFTNSERCLIGANQSSPRPAEPSSALDLEAVSERMRTGQSSSLLVGTSPTSWEEAAKNAVEEASKHLHDLRISEVEQLDMRLEDGKVVEYRARVHVSFRYKGSE